MYKFAKLCNYCPHLEAPPRPKKELSSCEVGLNWVLEGGGGACKLSIQLVQRLVFGGFLQVF